MNDLNNDIPLVVSTGDDVAYGGNYNNWQTLVNKIDFFKTTVFIPVTGNHSCYTYESSSNLEKTDTFFDAIINTPDNGPDEDRNTSFWFLYDSILFIGLDAFASNKNSSILSAQKEFFVETVEANEGKYQYIIVFQHYPWMDALTGGYGPYGTNYNQWHDLFEEYNVDLALGGDHHCYYRTNSLIDSKVVEEGGTTYIGAPQIGSRDREITEEKNPELYAKRITSDDLAGVSGLTYFQVTNKGITGTLIDTNGKIHDQYTIKARRSTTWESEKEGLNESMVITTYKLDNYLCFDSNYTKYIETLEIYNGSTKVFEAKPYETKLSSYKLDTLEINKAYNLTVKAAFRDDTKTEFNLIAHTYGNFGYVYNLQAFVSNSKLKLTWNAELQNNIVANFKVYVDDQSIYTLANSATSCEIDLSKVSTNSKYRLDVLSSNGDVLYQLNTNYSILGDANFDGVANDADITKIFENLNNNKVYKENELEYLDLNRDGYVDLGDAFTINGLVNKKIDSLVFYSYNVTILDINGQILYKGTVDHGEDVNFNANLYDFLTSSIKSVSSDITAVAVWK